MDLTKIYGLDGLKPKNKGHANFYECCDLTKKVCLIYIEKVDYKTRCIIVSQFLVLDFLNTDIH